MYYLNNINPFVKYVAIKYHDQLNGIILFLCCFLSILTQVPSILESSYGRLLFGVWGLPLMSVILSKNLRLIDRRILPINIWIYLWFFYVFLIQSLIPNDYWGSSCVYNSMISFSIFIIAYSISFSLSEKAFIEYVFGAALLGGIIFSLSIYNTAFSGGWGLSEAVYLYQAKNSAAQIIFACGICVFFFREALSKYKFGIIIIVGSLLLFLLLILILRSRATLLGFLPFLYLLLSKMSSRKIRIYTFCICSFVFLFLILNDRFYDLLVDGILFAQRDSSDVDDLSSGRFVQILNFGNLLGDNILFGKGESYIECFPLDIWLNTGLFGLLIMFFLFVNIMILLVKRITKKSLDSVVFILFVAYFFNSLFEQQAPLGPGSKCFFLWLCLGFWCGKRLNIVSRI